VLGRALDPAWLLALGVLLAPLAGYWDRVGVPGPVSPDRLLLITGLVLVLVRPRDGSEVALLRLRPLRVLLLMAALYAIGSAAAAGTLLDKDAAFRLLEAYGLVPFAVFSAAPYAFATVRRRRVLLGVMIALGVYLGLTALFETLGLRGLVFPRYITDPDLPRHLGRARGPFVEAVANGAAMFACAACALIALRTWPARAAQVASATALVLCGAGLVFTLQRSVWLGALVATLVTVASIPGLRRHLLTALVGLAVIGGAAFLAVPADRVQARAGDQQTIWDRQNMNGAAVRMIEERPLVGFGWATFPHASVAGDYFRQAPNRPLTAAGLDVHNVLLSHGAELGLVGMTLWLAALGAALAAGLRAPAPTAEQQAWRAALLAFAVFYAVMANFVPPQLFPNLLFWLFAGVACAGHLGGTSGAAIHSPRGRKRR
jgi:O-antigen ligase